MTRYLSMYLQGGIYNGTRLLSEAGIETMLTGNTNTKTLQLQSHAFDAQYAEGWFAGQFGAAPDARWHLGNLPQFTAWMVLLPDTNQAVVVLINAGSQFEIAGGNAVMSRIPVGIVDVLRGEVPPTGIGITRFFIIFDAIVLAVLAVQLWSLVRVAQRPVTLARNLRDLPLVLPLFWELGGGLFLLLAFPAMAGGGWTAALGFVPDLAAVVLAVALLWLATGAARLARLAQAGLAGRRAIAQGNRASGGLSHPDYSRIS
jgi:hypothetical protein